MVTGIIVLTCFKQIAMDEKRWDLMIREDVDRIYDRIVMDMNTDYNKGKIIVLVEGFYDKKFYDKFKNKWNALIFFTRGCEKMNALAEILRNAEYDYIAIQDSDFSNLGSANSGMTEMFFTDFHDYEMTCIHNSNIWNKLDKELDLTSSDISEQDIFDDIELLSYYRYCSRACDYNNGFKPVQKLVNTAGMLDFAFIHSHIDKSHPRCIEILEAQLKSFIFDHADAKKHPYDLHNGHDFLNRIVHKINQLVEHNYYDCDEQEIQEVLTEVTEIDDFRDTTLYKEINIWGQSHKQVFL